ncbi:DUF2470 domain-containing protein [Microbacterium sp. Clip185]|uniref:DUF2470 domain-containing protein n=1 Tax=Microbacterium sp. Clip185 TaxID=3025663 RepID=UPI0023656CE8|nr:DUF2470 domain-containing protein [Microbacterium sp. Clip185]WDG18239.1 DUF2470 domain-containing protein [Microbacterium sp. Clip185]
MTHVFDDETLAGVLGHMNSDHSDDNLLFARAFGPHPAPVGARMVGFDGDGGDWIITAAGGASIDMRLTWPGGPITERREVRREIVALYDAACAELGIEPRPH